MDFEDARADYSGNLEEEESTVNRSDVAGNPMEASLTGHESIAEVLKRESREVTNKNLVKESLVVTPSQPPRTKMSK
jgi:hypothetical protein